MPTIEAGNIFGKSIIYCARGLMAGIVLGAKAPVILTSRASSARFKIASIAFAALSLPD
jgi:phosphate butyryltransferase